PQARTGRRRTRPGPAAVRPNHHRGRAQQETRPRPHQDRPSEEGPHPRRDRPRRHPRETTRQPHRPRRPPGPATHHPPRPADGPTPTRLQRRTLARQRPERLPTRQRRIPRHHPSDHPTRHRRHHHLHPTGDQRQTPTPRQPTNHP